MKESLICALTTCGLVLMLNQTSPGQGKAIRTPAPLAAESSDREQDGLNGPVRRVRVESAKITVKDGNLIEGARALSEVATYDPRGTKIDSVAYPVEGVTLPGKQEYRYDNNGNIVEMTLRGDDGSTLSKESYKYELDELGNWKKMTSSVAIYENGKVSYEPIEVTYRSISYYYGQAVDKLALSASKIAPRSRITTSSSPSTTPASIPPTTSASEAPTASKVSARSYVGNANGAATENLDSRRISDRVKEEPGEESSSAVKTERQSNPTAETSSAANGGAEAAVPDKALSAPSESVSVKRVTEKELRDAAVNLPDPEYSAAARVGQRDGRVEVHVIVGENGDVVNARAASGDPMLVDAAETAARKSSFSRKKLSSDPGQLFGIITYDFKLPESKVALLPTSETPPLEIPKNKRVEKPSSAVSSTTPNVAPTAAAGTSDNSATSLYEKGLTHLAAGKYPEAVEAFTQSSRRNPNDVETYLKLGFAHLAQGQHKETVAALKMAIQIKPEAVDAQSHYHLAHAFAALRKHSEALESFKQALYITRAQAIDHSQTRAQNSPPLDQLHLGIGTMYYYKRRYQDAIEELKQAVTANPKLADAYYVLSLSYISMGNRIFAANQQKTLRTLNPALAEKVDAALSNKSDLLPCQNRDIYLCR